MTMKQVQLYGISKDDIQAIFENAIKKPRNRLVYLDVSYLYNFDVHDFDHVRKLNLLCRYDLNAVLEWHQMLERWLDDQTVMVGGHQIKPLNIQRSLDRVVNELMQEVAKAITGGAMTAYKYHAIGNGVFSEPTPADKVMVNQISRIDVTTNTNGGTLTRDGSTVYVVANHPRGVISADITETGVFNSSDVTKDLMLDHSKFATPIPHLQNQDIAGSTLVVWQCSG